MKNIRSASLITLMTLGLTQSAVISSCADSTLSQYRDQQTEELIKSFYFSNRQQLEITSVKGGSKVDAYCVLTPYQNDLSEKDNLAMPANSFLKRINLKMEEDYWHIVVKSNNQFILIRENVRSVPLAAEYSHIESSCVVGKALRIKKSTTSSNEHQTLKIGD